MDQGTFRRFKDLVRAMGFYRRRPGQVHSDGAVLAVYQWAVLNDRPVDWACRPHSWPPGAWRGSLPSQSCMSRRMRTERFALQLRRIEQAARPPVDALTLLACIDAKPLVVAWHSTDPHAGKGRGAGALARGYKLHALVDACGRLMSWRLAGLDVDEKVIGARLLRDLEGVCYVVGDAAYNSNQLFGIASTRGARLIAPRKRSHQGKGLGNHQHHPDRLRSIDLLEDGLEPFALALLRARRAVERFFGNLTNFGGGLTCLPPWVRGYPRTLAWTTAKLITLHIRNTRGHNAMAA